MTTSSEPEPTGEVAERALLPDWERIADGLPWRLKRGRDFDCTTKRLRTEAKRAAADMGRSVRFVRDRIDPFRFIWVQFGEAQVVAGSPCPRCGSERMLQLSGEFARCASCRALLTVERPPDVEEAELRAQEAADAARRAQETLAGYRNVHLSLAEKDGEHERFVGYGFDDEGRFRLLYVLAPLAGGERIPDESSPTGFLHAVKLSIEEPFGDRVDVAGLADVRLEGWDVEVP